MEPRVIQVAQIWDLEHNPVNGRIYSPDGIAPTLMTPTGGYFEPKILLEMEEKEIIPYNTPEDGVAPTITTMYARLGTNNLTPGEYGGAMGIMEISKDSMEDKNIKGVSVHPLSHKLEFDGNVNEEVSPCLRATDYKAPHCVWEEDPKSCASRKRGDEHKIETRKDELANCVTSIDTDSMIQEPQVLTPLRTEEGRQLRKQGIEKFSNRALYPREDGVSNTITSVQKDNLLQEPNGTEYKGKLLKEGDAVDTSRSETFGTHVMDGVSPALRSERPDANATCIKNGARYRIRKLTEREVFRLMDVSEEYIDKIQAAGISKTAQYKLAGNSIVVSCLYHIFRKMFIEPGCEEQQLSLF